MNTRMLHVMSVATSLTMVSALPGCGGGRTVPDPEPLTVPSGMTASDAPGVHARDAGDTIAATLPDSTRQFAPVSARSRMDEFHVKALSSDGNNGFVVTYVVGGQERTVHFEAGDYGTSRFGYDYYKETEDGGKFWLNSPFGSFTGDENNKGSPHFQYLDIYGSGAAGHDTRNRQHLTFGARTEAADLPPETATYSGIVRAENHPAEYANLRTRGRLSGNWRLTADFGAGTLQGSIANVSVLGPGESRYRFLPHTTSFSIVDGGIVDGRFTASLSGVDSVQGAAPGDTLEGFEGDILGEFYGPGAEEAGGVLRAARESDDRVLIGAFGGKRAPELDTSVPDGDLEYLSVAVDRDFVASTVRPSTDAQVTAIESDGSDGFRVTYRVDGVERRILLPKENFLYSGGYFGYGERTADGIYVLRDYTGSFTGALEFDHFSVHGWGVTEFTPENAVASIQRGFVVYGAPTEAADLPVGSATYEGGVHIQGWLPNSPAFDTRITGAGRLNLVADFDASTVGGAVHQIDIPFSPLTEVAIENGEIRGSALAADLRGSENGATFDGNLSGRFYGPGASEVGGVLEGSYADPQASAVVQGWFGGTKQ